jgi:hypothetical protein
MAPACAVGQVRAGKDRERLMEAQRDYERFTKERLQPPPAHSAT